MTVESQNDDWLDSRLAATSYLPDDGFTARVVESLPKAPRRAVSARTKILVFSAVIACGLIALLVPTLVLSAQQFLEGRSLNSLLALAKPLQGLPITVYMAAAALFSLGVAAFPLLRRFD